MNRRKSLEMFLATSGYYVVRDDGQPVSEHDARQVLGLVRKWLLRRKATERGETQRPRRPSLPRS